MRLFVETTRTEAQMPSRAHAGDAGLDLYCCHTVTLQPHELVYISNGIKVGLPPGTWGLLTGRSSSIRRGLLVIQGVIDNGYTGELYTGVRNVNEVPVTVEAGTRVSQLILMPLIEQVKVIEVTKLIDRGRGDSGFGSSGL